MVSLATHMSHPIPNGARVRSQVKQLPSPPDVLEGWEDYLSTQSINQHTEFFNILAQKWLRDMVYEHVGLTTTFVNGNGRTEYVVGVTNYRCISQQITPNEAHLRNLNYAMDLVADIELKVYQLPVHPEEPKRKDLTYEEGLELLRKADAQKEHDMLHRKLLHQEKLEDHIICSMPNMLHSMGCLLSDGDPDPQQHLMDGIFVTRGRRKYIPYVERLHYNEPMFSAKNGKYTCQIRSEHLDRPHRSTSTLDIMVRPQGKTVGQSKQIVVHLSYLDTLIPIHILVLCHNWTWDRFEAEIYRMNPQAFFREIADSYMNTLKYNNHGCNTPYEAIMFMAKVYKRRDDNPAKLVRSIVNTTLHSEIFPHLNQMYREDAQRTNDLKMSYLAWICGLLMRYKEGMIPGTNIDSYAHKVLQTSADMVAQLFRKVATDYTNTRKRRMYLMLKAKTKHKVTGFDKLVETPMEEEDTPSYDRINLAQIYSADGMTPKIISPISTGRWSDKNKGVSHTLRALNTFVIQSQMRRVTSSYMNKDGKHTGPRMIHVSSYGFLCSAETPEGTETCGLVYTLAYTAMITKTGNSMATTHLLRLVLDDQLVPLEYAGPVDPSWWKLIGPSGIPLGWIKDYKETLRILRQLRRSCMVDPHISFVPNYDWCCITVRTSGGRMVRPLLVVENLKKLPELMKKPYTERNLDTLLQHGIIEYLDPAEVMASPHYVSVSVRLDQTRPFDTHLELSAVSQFGLAALIMVFMNHNQGPRLVYEIGMLKQYMSPEMTMDLGNTVSHTLHYGQRPLVTTKYGAATSDGCNVIVALFPHPLCQEDAIVIKQEASERGLFTSSVIRLHGATHTPRNPNHPQDKFERPNPQQTMNLMEADYSKLDDDGMPFPGTEMKAGDIIIGKTIPPHNHVTKSSNRVKVPDSFQEDDYANYSLDASVRLRTDEPGTVLQVFKAPGIRHVRTGLVTNIGRGDKLSNRFGQKATTAAMLRAVDMPFSEQTGMIPDILMGPSSQPSRMTLGNVLELLLSKLVGLSGNLELGIDQQHLDEAYTEKSIPLIGDLLAQMGFNRMGRERMRCGMTGNLIETEIMMGPVWYGKMDHQSMKKAHARARGPVRPDTRQPTEGRRKEGGFCLGNMALDVLARHGVSATLNERTIKVSDPVTAYYCKQCGLPAIANAQIGLYDCQICHTSEHVRTVEQSYTTLLMFNELRAQNVSIKYGIEDIEPFKHHLPAPENERVMKRRKVGGEELD